MHVPKPPLTLSPRYVAIAPNIKFSYSDGNVDAPPASGSAGARMGGRGGRSGCVGAQAVCLGQARLSCGCTY